MMTSIMQSSNVFRNIFRTSLLRTSSLAKYSTKKSTGGGEESEYVLDDNPEPTTSLTDIIGDEIDYEAIEAEIERKRNKSGLLQNHRRMLHGEKPYDQAESWVHNTLRYQQVMYARYGEASGVDARLLFPTAEERAEALEYEQVAHPKTLKQMIDENIERRQQERETRLARDREVTAKMAKLNVWKAELKTKMEKREADAQAAIAKKAQLVDDIRRQFGFKMDSRDPRFKELLEKKEAEDKKASKAAKKQQMEAKMLQKLLQTAKGDVESAKEAPKPPKAAAEEAVETEIKESAPQKRGKKNKTE